ncbi:MFS general substrate transporter [Lepidopterella palustris CBS 459.81]|uniref:MFS general substrate transporter n=1 Tax=Lepidopterella palustris CBS 459.81 TaxID=1314670 RepID=A0A8E2J9Z9_9PEZI|nr:MFS general substrate transporter [Lepidopterella palustris CBS 459.81]
MPGNTSTISPAKPEHGIDKTREPTITSVPAEGKVAVMEIKTEDPVAASAPTGLTATDTIKPTGDPLGLVLSYPSGILQAVLIIALLLAMFPVALDMVSTVNFLTLSIIATAIPTITVEFHSVDQVGKAYKFFPLKTLFLACIAVFELGSLLIAVAQNNSTVIVGRAIQGAGGAGITGGCYIICAFITRPKRLPAVMGLFGIVWSCSSVLAPVLGGTPPHSRMASTQGKEIPLLFDFPGMIIMLRAFVCLLLALQDGGVIERWDSGIPIGLLVGFGLLVIIFLVVEWKQGERAMIVGRIMKRRSIAACSVAQAGGFARVYNLPIYFQAARGVSPAESGIRTLPSVLTISIFGLISSATVGKVGYYQPFLWAGAIFITVGSAMIYMLNPNSPASQYIGYQVISGIGMGLVIQVPVIVAQSISTRPDMAVTVAITLFYRFVGGAVGVSSAQSIMNNRLIAALPSNNPAISASRVLAAGANGLRQAFPNSRDLMIVVNAYMEHCNGRSNHFGYIHC